MSSSTATTPTTAELNALIAQIAAARDELEALTSQVSGKKHEKSFAKEVEHNRVDCQNIKHFYKDKKAGMTFAGWFTRPDTAILDCMAPYQPASCICERNALKRRAASWQPIGTLQTEYVLPGAHHKGAGEYDTKYSAKKVCPVKYRLLPEQMKMLQIRFPGWMFVTYDGPSHDHPVSHTSMKLSSRILVDGLPAGKYIDITGNPASNEAHNKRRHDVHIDTTCAVLGESDFVREACKWGDEWNHDHSARRWHPLWSREVGADGSSISSEELREYDGTLAFHTAYYMSPHEHSQLLARMKPKAVTHALVHRFGVDETVMSGSLNGGEQTWTRTKIADGSYMITQTNALTGETYSHRDNAWMFKEHFVSFSETTGLAWSTNLMCDDTYYIKFVFADPSRIGRPHALFTKPKLHASQFVKPEPLPNTTAWIKEHGYCLISMEQGTIRVPIAAEHCGVLSDMRGRMIGRARLVAEYKDHIAFCRMNMKRVAGAEKFSYTYEDLCHVITASFWLDLDAQTRFDTELFTMNYSKVWHADKLYKLGGNGSDRHKLGLAMDIFATTCLSDKKHVRVSELIQQVVNKPN